MSEGRTFDRSHPDYTLYYRKFCDIRERVEKELDEAEKIADYRAQMVQVSEIHRKYSKMITALQKEYSYLLR